MLFYFMVHIFNSSAPCALLNWPPFSLQKRENNHFAPAGQYPVTEQKPVLASSSEQSSSLALVSELEILQIRK